MKMSPEEIYYGLYIAYKNNDMWNRYDLVEGVGELVDECKRLRRENYRLWDLLKDALKAVNCDEFAHYVEHQGEEREGRNQMKLRELA